MWALLARLIFLLEKYQIKLFQVKFAAEISDGKIPYHTFQVQIVCHQLLENLLQANSGAVQNLAKLPILQKVFSGKRTKSLDDW